MPVDTQTNFTAGRAAFESYKEDRKGIAYDGKPIPEWQNLDPGVQHAWEASAKKVVAYHEFKKSLIKAHTQQAHAQDKRQSKPL